MNRHVVAGMLGLALAGCAGPSVVASRLAIDPSAGRADAPLVVDPRDDQPGEPRGRPRLDPGGPPDRRRQPSCPAPCRRVEPGPRSIGFVRSGPRGHWRGRGQGEGEGAGCGRRDGSSRRPRDVRSVLAVPRDPPPTPTHRGVTAGRIAPSAVAQAPRRRSPRSRQTPGTSPEPAAAPTTTSPGPADAPAESPIAVEAAPAPAPAPASPSPAPAPEGRVRIHVPAEGLGHDGRDPYPATTPTPEAPPPADSAKPATASAADPKPYGRDPLLGPNPDIMPAFNAMSSSPAPKEPAPAAPDQRSPAAPEGPSPAQLAQPSPAPEGPSPATENQAGRPSHPRSPRLFPTWILRPRRPTRSGVNRRPPRARPRHPRPSSGRLRRRRRLPSSCRPAS